MATIEEALKIEEGWKSNTLAYLSEIEEQFSTISDIMESAAIHVRDSEFEDLKECGLSVYEKKLVMVGYMICQRVYANTMEHAIKEHPLLLLIQQKKE